MNGIGARTAAILIASALGLGFVACGGDDDDDDVSATGGAAGSGATSSGGVTSGGSGGTSTGGTSSGGEGGSAVSGGSSGEGGGGPSGGAAGEPGTGAFATVVDCASSTPALTVDVTLPNFDPDNPSVDVGDVVEFENTDTMPHTATSTEGGPNPTADGRWASGNINAGESVCVRFDQAGESDFFCEYHPAMTGTLTVR